MSGLKGSYYHSDGLGSTMKTTDASGTVVNSYAYDVYGNVTSQSGTRANEFQFAGQQTDPTGLQYLRARYYDPATGTFLSREPMAAAPGWAGNPFGYAAANPAVLSDPTGAIPEGPGFQPGCSGLVPLCWLGLNPSEHGLDLPPYLILEGLFYGDTGPLAYRLCELVGEYTSCGRALSRTEFASWLFALGQVVVEITLEGASPVTLRATKKAEAMVRSKRWGSEKWTADDVERIMSGQSFVDSQGNTVWVVRRGDKFDWMVRNPDGVFTSLRKGESLRSYEMAKEAYKWKSVP